MKKRASSRRAIGIACAISFVSVVLFFAWGIVYALTDNTTVSIFADISECDAIAAKPRTDATFQSYESPAKDKFAEGLEYTAFFGGAYKDASCNFEIFAYVFVDEETAAAYFERQTGKDTDLEYNFSGNIGLFRSELVVVRKNMAYIVHMPSRCNQEVYKLLSEVFSVTIRES